IGARRVIHHRRIAEEFSKLARAAPDLPDLIHVGNVPLELCEAAVRFGKEMDIPVVLDIRDLWPDIYLDLVPRPLRFLKPVVRALLHFSYRSARYSMSNATAITGITEPFVDWGVKLSRRERRVSDRVFHMSYPESKGLKDPDAIKILQGRLGLAGGEFIACYFGNLGYQSDFRTLLNAAKLIPPHSPIRFVICGDGPKLPALRREAAGMTNVILPGWIDPMHIPHLMHIASVGLLPFKDTDNYVLNMPNKFSEYLSGGLVLACGVRGEMASLVRANHCGFVYPTGDAIALAGELQAISADPDRCAKMKAQSRHLFRTQFNCEVVYAELCDYLEDLAERGSHSKPIPTSLLRN